VFIIRKLIAGARDNAAQNIFDTSLFLVRCGLFQSSPLYENSTPKIFSTEVSLNVLITVLGK